MYPTLLSVIQPFSMSTHLNSFLTPGREKEREAEGE